METSDTKGTTGETNGQWFDWKLYTVRSRLTDFLHKHPQFREDVRVDLLREMIDTFGRMEEAAYRLHAEAAQSVNTIRQYGLAVMPCERRTTDAARALANECERYGALRVVMLDSRRDSADPKHDALDDFIRATF